MIRTVRTVGLTALGVACIVTGLACSGDPTPRPTNEEPVFVHTASATEAVCSATRNAYLQDAIGSDITGKAIFNLSNQEHVDTGVHNAVHDLFTATGKTTSTDYESAYRHVMKACSSAGWEPK
jgi:hypothetical protein